MREMLRNPALLQNVFSMMRGGGMPGMGMPGMGMPGMMPTQPQNQIGSQPAPQ